MTVFTVGSVLITRRTAGWVLDDARWPLLWHELRHTTQYAFLGPLFWPVYWWASFWSYLLTGSFGGRNFLEEMAGLPEGGYAEIPSRLDDLRQRW